MSTRTYLKNKLMNFEPKLVQTPKIELNETMAKYSNLMSGVWRMAVIAILIISNL